MAQGAQVGKLNMIINAPNIEIRKRLRYAGDLRKKPDTPGSRTLY